MVSIIKKCRVTSLIALAVVSLAMVAQPALATTINYGLLANTSPGEGGYPNSVGGFSLTVDGITVSATSGVPGDNAYLDSYFEGRPGGLGVCQDLNSAGDCSPSSDDNLTNNGHLEELILTFSENVLITEVLIRNGLHSTVFTNPAGGLYRFTFNGVEYDLTHSFVPTAAAGTGLVFAFTAPYGDTDNGRMYVEAVTFTAVPESGMLLLLGSGLVGLGLMRRRFKK